MHLGATECLVVGFLAGGHLHQWGSGEEHLGSFLDHHDVIGHARHVCAPGGGVAEYQRDGGDARRGQACEVAEQPPAGDEDLLLRRQVRTPGLDEVDHGKPILKRDIVGAQSFPQRPGIAGTAADGGVVRHDHALHTVDDADAGHRTGADGELGAPGSERRELEEGRVRVDQQFDALTGQQFAALVVALDVLLPPPASALVCSSSSLGEFVAHRLGCRAVLRRRHVESRLQDAHAPYPSRFAASPVRISVVPPRFPECACRGTGARLPIPPCIRGRRTVARPGVRPTPPPRPRCSWRNTPRR